MQNISEKKLILAFNLFVELFYIIMKNLIINISLVIISVIIAFTVIEIALRIKGYMPTTDSTLKNEPKMFEQDSILGWRNKEGVYNYPGYGGSDKNIEVTILKGGFRKTSSLQNNDRSTKPKILYIGGSFTYGFAISDHENFAWKTQEKLLEYEILNAGVNAYGSYQSLLNLEIILPELNNPKVIIYGMIQHHANRNTAPTSWAGSLTSTSRVPGGIRIPYATYSNEKVIRHEPKGYKTLPLSNKLSTFKLLERKLLNYKAKVTDQEKQKILLKNLEEMNALSKRYGAKFIVLDLGISDDEMRKMINELNIPLINSPNWEYLDDGLIVKGEGHPNGKMHSIWAASIYNYFKDGDLHLTRMMQ